MNLLLMSSSRKKDTGYLEHALGIIDEFLLNKKRRIGFIPYASVQSSYEAITSKVQKKLETIGCQVSSIHDKDDKRKFLQECDAICVSGGNTFSLLSKLEELNLINFVKDQVRSGKPYLGWSAGSNVACPTIKTTNDMPIEQPNSFSALELVPFQINAHFIAGKRPGHNGESREQRIEEFLIKNNSTYVIALPEGSALKVYQEEIKVCGEYGAYLFNSPGDHAQHLPEGSVFNIDRQ